jgi:hypothetical protein
MVGGVPYEGTLYRPPHRGLGQPGEIRRARLVHAGVVVVLSSYALIFLRRVSAKPPVTDRRSP